MIDPSSFLIFMTAALLLLLAPGPAVLYIVARSIDQGARAGVVSSLGMFAGGFFHVAAAAFGLSAILMTSALAFSVVKYAGAAYLIYLGIKTLTSARNVQPVDAPEQRPLRRIFREAVIVQMLNPKAAIFFFAFLPQFVNPERGSALVQILVLGFSYGLLGLCTDSSYALLAGRIGATLRSSARALRAQRYVAGVTYISLGMVTATSGSAHD